MRAAQSVIGQCRIHKRLLSVQRFRCTTTRKAIFVELKQIEVCTVEFFAARAGVGAPNPDPIFIIGLPRSGSTLVEQILASHSQVEGTQELPKISRMVRELEGPRSDPDNPRYPAVLAGLALENFRKRHAGPKSRSKQIRQRYSHLCD